MHVTKHLEKAEKAKRAIVSIEVLPPVRGGDAESLFSSIDAMAEFSPAFINVTHHQREFRLHIGPGGHSVLKQTRKRPGTVGICAAIRQRYQIDTVAHLIAAGHSKEELENILIELSYLGIDNILALRGDRVKNDLLGEEKYSHANVLVSQIAAMNKGIYLDKDIPGAPTQFQIGVAGYPEKHYEAPNLEEDILRLKEKVNCGASYIITQMFFNNKYYFQFVKKARKAGIKVPIIPGLKPISNKRHLSSIPGFFHVDLPPELANALKKTKNNEEVKEIGIAWCSSQAKELIKNGAPCIHFYTMGKGSLVKKVIADVF